MNKQLPKVASPKTGRCKRRRPAPADASVTRAGSKQTNDYKEKSSIVNSEGKENEKLR